MDRPDPHHVDPVAASQSLTADRIRQNLIDLAAVLSDGDGDTALVGIVLTVRALAGKYRAGIGTAV